MAGPELATHRRKRNGEHSKRSQYLNQFEKASLDSLRRATHWRVLSAHGNCSTDVPAYAQWQKRNGTAALHLRAGVRILTAGRNYCSIATIDSD